MLLPQGTFRVGYGESQAVGKTNWSILIYYILSTKNKNQKPLAAGMRNQLAIDIIAHARSWSGQNGNWIDRVFAATRVPVRANLKV